MKKLIAIILTASILMGVLSSVAGALGITEEFDNFTVYAEKDVAELDLATGGTTFNVDVKIANNPGIQCASVMVVYPEALSLATDYGTVNSDYRNGIFFSDGTEDTSDPDISLDEPDDYKAETIIRENGIATEGKRYSIVAYELYDLDAYTSADGLLTSLAFALTDKAVAGESYSIELYCESNTDFSKIGYRDEVGFPWYDYYTPDMVGTEVSVVDGSAAEKEAFKIYTDPDNVVLESDDDEFSLDVMIDNNPGLWAARFFVVYPEAFSLADKDGYGHVINSQEIFPAETENYSKADIDLTQEKLSPDLEGIIEANGVIREGYRCSVVYFQLDDIEGYTDVNGCLARLCFSVTDKAVTNEIYSVDLYYDPSCDFIKYSGIVNGLLSYETYAPEMTGASVRINPPCPHENTTTEKKAPTCTSNGFTRVFCDDCQREISFTVQSLLGHSYGDWETESLPDCTNYGYDVRECATCGHRDRAKKAPLGHSFGGWITDVEATVVKEGHKHRICFVCGGVENKVVDRVQVDIETNEDYGLANFTVVNAQSLDPIRGAQIFVSTDTEGESTFFTDASGKVSMILPVGKQKISVYSDGCITRNLTVNIKTGVNDINEIGLSNMSTYEVELTSERMTLEEIERVGIDTTNPSNQNVFKYELKLDYGAEIDVPSIIAYFNYDGDYLGGHHSDDNGSGDGDNDGNDDGPSGDDEKPDSNTLDDCIRIPVGDDTLNVYPLSEYFYLIVKGEVKWLKEMFDVEMLIINNSQTDTLEDLSATLELPTGLSLAKMVNGDQSLTQEVDLIDAGDSKSLHWYVKGDSAGSYGVTVNLKGTVMPFEETIDETYVCRDQIQVWSADALKLHFDFPNAAYYGDDYPITITLTNVSDISLYNVSHLLSVEQGMKVYYSDNSTESKTEISNWMAAGVRELLPGDSIVIEANANIFFESAIINEKLNKYIGIVDGIENLINGYKAVKAVIDVIDTAKKAVTGCLEAILEFDHSSGAAKDKIELLKKLYNEVSDVAEKIDTGDHKVLSASASLVDSGIKATFEAISKDPEKWLEENSVDDIKDILDKLEGLKTAIDEMETGETGEEKEKEFNIFDSIRTAINAIPVRYVIDNVIMTTADSNTANIEWTYSVQETGPRYFGVSSVSKYIDSLLKVAVSEGYEEIVPFYVKLIPGMDDPYDKDEAIKYIQATENEIAKVKAKDATGNVTFRAWIESGVSVYNLNAVNDEGAFALSCDNKEATYEDGVLTFTGDTMINVTPTGSGEGILYIEDSEGNLYTYVIDVVEAHTCKAGARQIIVAPSEESDGFGVKCCEICSEVMEIVTVSYKDICGEHTYSEWIERAKATCTGAGVYTRECSVCGITEYRYTDTLEHQCSSWTLTKTPTCVEYGEESAFCTSCEQTVVRKVDTVDHTEGEWRTTKEPSAFKEGEKILYCSVCDAPLGTETLPFTKETFGYKEGESNGFIVGLPHGVTPEMLIAHYKNMGLDVRVTGADGESVQYVGTGCFVYFGQVKYTIILGGDMNGDGKLNALDSNIMRRIITGSHKLDSDLRTATDVNGDGLFNSIDINLLTRYIIGLKE